MNVFTEAETPQTTPLINPFLRYLALGWSVIPLQARGKLPESRLLPTVEDEAEPSKRKRSWKPYQTTAPTQAEVEAWWRNPSLNVGIVTGQVSGIVVLDLDNPLAIRTAYDWGVPQTPTVATGKGLHLYFRCLDTAIGNRANFASVEGFDFRGEGGYVVAPPSLHPEGRTYEWLHSPEDVALAEMPEWLQTLLLKDAVPTPNAPLPQTMPVREQGEPPAPPEPETQEDTDLSEAQQKYRFYAEQTIQAELQRLAGAPPGERNDHLNRSAFKLGQLVGIGVTDEQEIERRLTTVALTLGLTRKEARATIASGVRAGKGHPRVWLPGEGDPPDTPEARQKRESQASALIRLGKRAILFHNQDKELYARYAAESRYETHLINHPKSPFRLWVERQYFKETGITPGLQALQQALQHLEQEAYFEGDERKEFTRLGYIDDKVYLSLGDKQGHIVEVDREGWRLVQDAPLMFRTGTNAEALPIPERGGSVDALRPLLNLRDEKQWKLCVGWMVGALNPRGPYAHLVVHGEQGSGKSSLLRGVRACLDPAQAEENTDPRTRDDFMVTCLNNHIVSYDNLSALDDWFSDGLCRISSGAGLSKRKLYTNDLEVVIKVARPALLNGLLPLVQRPDLMERVILMELPRIRAEQRITERAFHRELERVVPGVLGALLEAVVVALQRRDTLHLPALPRMADFVTWVEAAAPALGWAQGAFLEAYDANILLKEEQVLELDEVAETLIAWADYKLQATGDECVLSMKQLLTELTALRLAGNDPHRLSAVAPNTRPPADWPDSPRGLLARLVRANPILRHYGIEYERGLRHKSGQHYRLRRWGDTP